MQSKRRLSLGTQSLLILLLPLAGLCWFTFQQVNEARRTSNASDLQIMFAQIAGAASVVVHETQKERGLTSGVLGAGNEAFRAKLPNQRATRDAALADLKTVLADIDTDALGDEVNAVLTQALSYTDAIADTRSAADAETISQGDAVAFYTEVVGSYIALVNNMPKLSTDPSFVQIGNAYTALLRIKEASGLERAIASVVFGRDELTPPLKVKLLTLLTTQNLYKAELFAALPAAMDSKYGALLGAPEVTNAESIRQSMFDNPNGRGFGVSAVDWFDTQSVKINQLKSIEEQLLADMVAVARATQDQAHAGMQGAILIGIGAVLTVLFAIGWNITRFKGLQRDLGAEANYLSDVLGALGRGDFSMNLDTGKPATGVFAGLQEMKSKLETQVETDRAALAASNRVDQALDKVASPVVVTDEAMSIVFMNEAATRLFEVLDDSVNSQQLTGSPMSLLPGFSIDDQQRVSKQSRSESKEREVNGRILEVVSTPVLGDAGDRVGSILVLSDRTSEVVIEKDVESVVAAASQGDLSQRIATEGLDGFYATLSASVNALLTSLEDELGERPEYLNQVLEALGRGDFGMDLNRSEPTTGVFAGLQKMKARLEAQVEKDRQQLAESNRITEALDNVDGPVIVTDDHQQLVFINQAAQILFGQLGGAGVSVGSSVSDVPGLSGAQAASLATLTETQIEQHEVGRRTLRVVSNPVMSHDGGRLGSIVVWDDLTDEVNIQHDVDTVVRAARSGDLSQRIRLDGLDGFYATLSEGVNNLLEVAEQVIGDTVRVLAALAKGDLTQTIDVEYSGSFDQLKQDANATVTKLTDIISNLQSAAVEVKNGALEIANGNSNLATRTENQAADLEQAAQSMSQVADIVRESATNAADARGLASSTEKKATRGGEVVSGTITAMQAISESSRKIQDIIVVIDELAFQTNLLALNAAVEAARAGDQGRGFAVVASEVRNLAGRSASAAREIKTLIQDSGEKVEEGTRLVNESGETLDEIVSAVQQLAETVDAIAQSSAEQHRGIDNIKDSIDRIDSATQQNATLVEEASVASGSLRKEAEQMDRLASFFNTNSARAASAGRKLRSVN